MFAIVAHDARDLRIDRMDDPREPGPGEVKIRLRFGGICGSDLHYFNHGGFGAVRIRQPMILGHEASGTVEAIGQGVTNVKAGDTVAVNPSMPCRHCSHCKSGQANLCSDVRFAGSAMRFPHVQGLFREAIVVPAEQALPVSCSAEHAALAEPFAVTLHAAMRAGSLLGRRVLVSGSGPIGCLMVLSARLAGAAEIVVTDIRDEPLSIARKMGADRTINLSGQKEAFDSYAVGRGYFDVCFECSGSPQAIAGAIGNIQPGGKLVLVGLGGEAILPTNSIVTKEISIVGTFRFDDEFALAANLLSSGQVDPSPLITHTLPLAKAEEAFLLATDRTRAMKVQIDLAS